MTAAMMKKKVMSIACTGHMVRTSITATMVSTTALVVTAARQE